ncbi:MAG TPA: EamA family transporter [Candidatus Saccharimonadia bacterium]
MTWFWLALLSPLLWSINNHIDKYLFTKYYQTARPGSLMFIMSGVSAVLAAAVFIFNPAARQVPLGNILILLLGGVLYFAGIFQYIFALMRDEASRVVPLFQIGPIFSYLLAWVILHEQLQPAQLAAGALIIIAAVGISLDLDDRFRLKKAVLGYMLLATIILAVEGLLFKIGAAHIGFWPGAAYQYAGTALAGVIWWLVAPAFRQDFRRLFRQHRQAILTVSILNESINVLARVAYNAATLLAPIALVALVTNVQPFFVIALGIMLTVFAPQWGKETLSRRHLMQKIICTATIFVGTALLIV